MAADAPTSTPLPPFRIGQGWDLHRLEPRPPEGPGRPLIVGGIQFDHERGPVSHSDGDVLLHALTDALLGALGEPDIGQLFPDDDPRHESQDSRVFLEEAARRARARGYEVGNADCTVILERPKLGPRKAEVREHLAAVLGVPPGRVNVKGKTHEKVDAIGEGRAVGAMAIVLLVKREATA